MATVTKQFSADFDLWAESLRAEGESEEGIEEIREAIRAAFAEGGDATEYWRHRVAEEAAFIRQLRARGAGITARIRAELSLAEKSA